MEPKPDLLRSLSKGFRTSPDHPDLAPYRTFRRVRCIGKLMDTHPGSACVSTLAVDRREPSTDRWHRSGRHLLGGSRDVQPESLLGVVQLEEASHEGGKEFHDAVDGNHLWLIHGETSAL